VIKINDYIWFGYNRADIHINAPKASGGVGLLVKSKLCDLFDIHIVDKSFDGILCLKFCHKITGSDFIVFTCYLPPENSNRGRDAQSFYAHLLTQIYSLSNCDAMFIAADFNARIGNLSDILYECDMIPTRTIIDKSINQHGHEFVDFLNEAKFCCLNGRLNTELDNFTSISGKGKAVVDYICVPHDIYDSCKTFKVLTMQSVVDLFQLHGLIGDGSRLPDHSVLITEYATGYNDYRPTTGTTPNKDRYNLRKIPSDFMTGDLSRRAIANLITIIETTRENQTSVDSIYCDLCSIITTEMRAKLPVIGST